MRRFVLGTAGHVDHGKTTLVRALTGIDTDRLPEEKRRGISIELGFAPLDLGEGLTASIIDVPGHRRLVRAMIAGAAGMELVMLVVAADEGIMPQTREHVAVCELLGLSRAVVVVTKVDAVEPELATMAGEEARALLGQQWSADLVQVSARTGLGLDALRTALRRALQALPPRPEHASVRLGVDRVFAVRGAGTVVTGTLVSGRVVVGDALHVVGERTSLETAARGLHVHDAAVQVAEAPTRLAINLAGVRLEDVRRGSVVSSDPHLRATTQLDLLVRGKHAVRRGAEVTVHVGTAASEARVDATTPVSGVVVARLRLTHATALSGGDRVVLRGGGTAAAGAVVGGGVVVDAYPERRTTGAKRRALAEALATSSAEHAVVALVASRAPRLLERRSLPGRLALDVGALSSAADAAPSLVRIGEEGWVARDQLEASIARARSLVRDHARKAPLERGMPIETLREQLGVAHGRALVDEVLRRASSEGAEGGRLFLDGDVVRMSAGPARVAPAAQARLDAVARILQEAGIAGMTETTILARSGLSSAEARSTLQHLLREGAATRIGELWFDGAVVTEGKRRLLAHFAGAATITVLEFKALSGMARKQAVLLLEHFDQVGLTRRQGDARVLR